MDRPEASSSDMYTGVPQETEGFSDGQAQGTRVRQVQPPKARIGQVYGGFDPRKWGNFDVARGVSANVVYEISRDDRMSATEAGAMMRNILEKHGLGSAVEGRQLAFMRGMFLCHAVNSGSQLQPGRSTIYVDGSEFPYYEVVKILGPAQRRFYRAFADEVRAEVARQLKEYSPLDPVSREVHSWIMELAVDRALQRHPDLIADSASACTSLNLAERAAISRSTNLVLSTTVNAIDSMTARSKPLSADQFDSTNGQRVENAASTSHARA